MGGGEGEGAEVYVVMVLVYPRRRGRGKGGLGIKALAFCIVLFQVLEGGWVFVRVESIIPSRFILSWLKERQDTWHKRRITLGLPYIHNSIDLIQFVPARHSS